MNRRQFFASGTLAVVAVSTPRWKFWGPQEQYVELPDLERTYRFERVGAVRRFSGRWRDEPWITETAGEGESATEALARLHWKLHDRARDAMAPHPMGAALGPNDTETSFRAGLMVGMWDAKFGRRR